VIASLGSITALVSWLVHGDLRVLAEDNNFEMNRRSAMEAETMLTNIRSNSRILIQTVTSLGTPSVSTGRNVQGSQTAAVRASIDFFFAENPSVAAVFYFIPGGREQLMVNEQFFRSWEMYQGLAESYFQNQREALGRAVRGETLLRNATPHFARPMLALFYQWQSGGVGGVLFSSDILNENFGFGINQSYMLNSEGDILSHPDSALLSRTTNLAGLHFISNILRSNERSRQQLIEADFSVLESGTRATSGIFPGIKQLTQKVITKLSGILPGNSNQTGYAAENMQTRKFVAFTKLNVAAGAVVITSIEYDKVFEGVYATTRRNIYLTIAVLSISIIFVWFFSKTISIPLRTLAKAARKIEGGDFNQQFKKESNDEIGVLTNSFQKMCSALHVFGRFTNKEIAVKAMRGEIKPGGLPKHGTVFFSDIREFTAKSEGFTKYFGLEASDKIVHWLNSYFTEMVDCVEKTNGVVDKFIGDAVMAHWGTAYSAGSPRKDAFNAVKAALMMRKALFYLNKSRKAGDPANPPIRIGCGLNSGIITAGQLGSEMRMEYTVIGDPVNLASRIEALTKPLGADILISEDTWKLIGDRFICEEMPSVTVKGKVKPVRIFAVVNFIGEPKGPQTLDEVRKLLCIEPPEMEQVDVNADEKKYKIGEAN
jgi:adenylate cyclase